MEGGKGRGGEGTIIPSLSPTPVSNVCTNETEAGESYHVIHSS